MATFIAADLYKIQQEKGAEISSPKRKFTDQKEQQKKTQKKLRKEHEKENHGSMLQVKIIIKKLRTEKKNSKIYFQREKNKVIKMHIYLFDAQKVYYLANM